MLCRGIAVGAEAHLEFLLRRRDGERRVADLERRDGRRLVYALTNTTET